MPGGEAKVGDAYWVAKEATERPALVGKPSRPMACMAERPADTAWSGLARTTTNPDPADLKSRAMPEIKLDKDGWWTGRDTHPVLKRLTGVRGKCDYLGKVPHDELKIAKKVWRYRHDNY